MPRIKPWATGCEAQTLPLCYAPQDALIYLHRSQCQAEWGASKCLLSSHICTLISGMNDALRPERLEQMEDMLRLNFKVRLFQIMANRQCIWYETSIQFQSWQSRTLNMLNSSMLIIATRNSSFRQKSFPLWWIELTTLHCTHQLGCKQLIWLFSGTPTPWLSS